MMLVSLAFQLMAGFRPSNFIADRVGRQANPDRRHAGRCVGNAVIVDQAKSDRTRERRFSRSWILQELGDGPIVRCVMCWSAFAIKDLMQAGRWQQIFRSPLDRSPKIRQSHNESFLARLCKHLPCCMVHRIQVISMADFGIPTSGHPQATWRRQSSLLQVPRNYG